MFVIFHSFSGLKSNQIMMLLLKYILAIVVLTHVKGFSLYPYKKTSRGVSIKTTLSDNNVVVEASNQVNSTPKVPST